MTDTPEPTRSITITLPVPPKEVRPNGRPHWRAKAAAVKKMRVASWSEAILNNDNHLPKWTHASIKIDWFHPTTRFLDRDNIIASCKAYIDGIVDAGVLSDDRDVTYEPVGRFKAAAGTYPRVELTVTQTQQEDE